MSIRLVLVIGIGLLFAPCAQAQRPGPKAPPAGQPRKDSGPRSIWDYRQELGLSDPQVVQIKEALMKAGTFLKDARTRILGNERQLRKLIDSGGSVDKMRPYLRSNADIQVEMRVVDIEAAHTISGVLRPDQLAKWRDIQKKKHARLAPAGAATAGTVP